jgi:hypothetical protein
MFATAIDPRYQATANNAASSSHCAARAREDGRLTTPDAQCQVGIVCNPPFDGRLFMPRGRPRPPLSPNVASYTSP